MANQTAYGFVTLEHMFADRVTALDTGVLAKAIQESAQEHTNQINALMSGLVEVTTDRSRRHLLSSSGTLQPLDEHGNPLPVRPEGSYPVGFPIQGGGTAWGDDRVTRALMTVAEANRFTVDAFVRDIDWLQRHLLAAVFDNVAWTFADPQDDVNVVPLANGDTVIYNRAGGTSATDNHYLAQAAGIADVTNPFGTLYSELSEHPGNRGPFIAYIPTNLRSDTEALIGFIEITDPDITLGANSDRVSGAVDAGFGDEVIGKVNKMWIVEWKALPDDYILAHARGNTSPLAMRQYPAAEIQGFFPEFHNVDGNHMVNRMLRYAGFGVQDRVAMAVMRVGNGTYAIPAGYDAPLAI